MTKENTFWTVVLSILLAAIIALAAVYFYRNWNKPYIDQEMSTENNDAWEIVYSKDNGSLPPDYHREGVLTISKSADGNIEGEYVVSDYERVLERRTIEVSVENFNDINAYAVRMKLKGGSLSGCTGGSGRSVKVLMEEKLIMEASSYHCGGESTNPSVDDFTDKLEVLFPLDYEVLTGSDENTDEDEKEADAEVDEDETDETDEFAFDGCGIVKKHSSKSWYGDFIAKLQPEITREQFNHLNSTSPYENSDACLSLDGSLFIVLIPDTGYLTGDGQIFRYKTTNGVFETAIKGSGFSGDTPGEPLHEFGKFGKRVVNYVGARGYLYDSNIAVDWYYRYDFNENRYDIVKHCSWEVDNPEDMNCDETL